MDNLSQTSRSTAYTSRAISLLEKVRQVCDACQIQEFHSTLAAFKRKEIDAKTTHERVSRILESYPALLEEFAFYVPVDKEGEKEPVTSNFNFAMSFVQQVRASYADQPLVYSTFLSLLKDYQMGKVTQTQVLLLVSDLLKETPGLVTQFKNFYGRGALSQENIKSEMVRASSSDTIVQNSSDPRFQLDSFVNLTEEEPFLEQDLESGSATTSTRSFYKKFIAFMVFTLTLLLLATAAVYYDWIKLLRQ